MVKPPAEPIPESIPIRVTGCVRNMGKYQLRPCPTSNIVTLGDAIDAAGGFGGQGMQPTGIITIRRKVTDAASAKDSVRGIRLNFKASSQDLETPLENNDSIVVQFDVESCVEPTVSSATRLAAKQSESLRPTATLLCFSCITAFFCILMLTAFIAQINRDTHPAWACLRVVVALAGICGGILLIGGSLRDQGTKQISLSSMLGLTVIVAAYLSIAQAAITDISPQQIAAAPFEVWLFAVGFFLVFGYLLFRVLANFSLCLVWLAVDLQRRWKRVR